MIRLIQRRLIIPRGDTGSFTIPVIKPSNENIAVFTIFDETTHTKLFQKKVVCEGDVINIAFSHNDTVNLKPGKYLWDIKYYSNPLFVEDELVDGEEIDSYYAGYSLPACEIRPTGDDYLVSDDAPSATLAPGQLDIITSAITALNEAVEQTQTNVEHYPIIRDEIWYVWDAESNDYVSTGVDANGIAGNGIASAVLNNDYSLTLNFTDGTSFTSPSIRGATGNGIDDIVLNNDFTLTIIYTDGERYTTPSIRGPVGATPQFSIGTVQDGAVAAASITGTAENPVLNLTLPNAHVPTRVSQLENDSGYLTAEVDPTVPQWAKAPTKPSYTPQEVGALPADTYIPQKTSDLTNDSNYAVDVNYVHTDNNYTTAEKEKLSGIAAGAEVNVNADWNAISGDAQILNKPTNVSDFINDAGYLTTETDPTVPAWAKTAQKPTYTASEVGAPTIAEMNTAIGTAIGQINSFDMAIVQTLPTQNISTHTIYLVPKIGETNDVYDEYVYINNKWEMIGNTQIDLSDYVLKSELPTKVSELSNDSGYLTSYTETDPTVPQWAKASTKPSYTATEVGALPSDTHIPSTTAELTNDAGFITVNDIPEVPVTDVQINSTSIITNGVANIPVAGTNTHGVIKVKNETAQEAVANGGSVLLNGVLYYTGTTDESALRYGYDQSALISTSYQHKSTFYGLAKAAGVAGENAGSVGTYTDTAKTAIRSMLGATSNNVIAVQDTQPTDPDTKIWLPETAGTSVQVPTVAEMNAALAGKVDDVQINGASVVSGGIANLPIITSTTPGIAKVDQYSAYGINVRPDGTLQVVTASDAQVKSGNAGNDRRPITPSNQHASAFYGLAKAAGDTTQSQSDNAVGTYTNEAKAAIKSMIGVNVEDVQVNGTSVLSNGVANIPMATETQLGTVKPNPMYGIGIFSAGGLKLELPTATQYKTGSVSGYRAVQVGDQHVSTFYGLAKASGDTTQSASSNAVGLYTDNAKASIKSMLGIVDGSTGTVEVTGTTPTITAVENTRYVCGEVATLSFTPPASGISIVRFTSGTTATVLTLPNTVIFPEWFDATTLEANTVYEMCITDGIYGAVMSWAQ